MSIKVITPNGLDYFKQLQDQYNSLLFSLQTHGHTAQDVGAAELVHEHEISDVNGLTGVLAGKASSDHTHGISTIAGLQDMFDSKANVSHVHTVDDVTGLRSEVDGKSDIGHTHTISNITSLQSKLDDISVDISNKADKTHTHTTAQVTGLDSALSGKANSSHTHTISNIAGLSDDLSELDESVISINSDISTITTNLNQSYSLKRGTKLVANDDLDMFKTVGNYICQLDTVASTVRNSPTGGRAFALKVGDLLDNEQYWYQEATRYTDGASWRRTFDKTNNRWNPWYSTSFAPSRKMLWSGSWNAGSIEVTGLSDYNAFVFYAGSGSMLIGFKSYDGLKIHCYGNLSPERNVMKIESSTFTVSGNTLTRVMPRTWTMTGTAITAADAALVFTRIEGLF